MQTVHDLEALRAVIREWRRTGFRIALVPTMGNLHAGHLSLLAHARATGCKTVVSIFVNPIQFGKGEDYARYPSTLEQDRAKLSANGLDLLFAPDLGQLYPGGMEHDTRVTVPELSHILCGEFRPGPFSGVATVVSKLFINVQPDYAIFGEKDYQQLLVIRRMVRDLCMPVEIVAVPILREEDGLAMSSRNQYLTEAERKQAPLLYRTLQESARRLQQGSAEFAAVEAHALQALEAGGFRPEYFSIRRREDLGKATPGESELIILVAAWLGSARLIDNLQLELVK